MSLRLKSLFNDNGFTLPEILIASFLMIVIMGALVMTLRVGDLSMSVGTERVDVEADVKLLMSWMVKDIRQAKIQELHGNDPATDHIMYNLWEWNNNTLTQENTNEFIEYSYDAASEALTRRHIVDGVIENEVSFTDIKMPPFYTTYTDESVNGFDPAVLLGTRRLIIAVKKQREIRGSVVNFTMVEEIRIRNE
mgnify:CR=1 FL=1